VQLVTFTSNTRLTRVKLHVSNCLTRVRHCTRVKLHVAKLSDFCSGTWFGYWYSDGWPCISRIGVGFWTAVCVWVSAVVFVWSGFACVFPTFGLEASAEYWFWDLVISCYSNHAPLLSHIFNDFCMGVLEFGVGIGRTSV
jgi:hypothetical protein